MGRVHRWSRGRHDFVTAADPYVQRTATADDHEEIWRLLNLAFGNDFPDDARDVEGAVFEPERAQVIVYNGEIVANAAAYTRDLTVPGGPVPAAHVSLVSVLPTHRRRGLLRRLMVEQLRTVPEPIAVLWASEGRIYQRFGYGMAAKTGSLEINTLEISMLPAAPAVGSLRVMVPAEIRKDMQEVYERKRASQPGLSSRDDRWWDHVTSDLESRRAGHTARRAVLYEGPDGPGGYAVWRSKSSWDSKGPKNETKLVELIALHPEAYAALWRFLLSIDLARSVHASFVATEEPILYLVNEPNQLGMRVGDGLWVRVVDLPVALAARRYPVPVDVVLAVTDELLPANAGRWRLRTNPDGTADCTPAGEAPADLAMDIADLGAVYLGGTPLGALASAGRVRELRPGTLAAANSAFSWPVAPAPMEIF